jgi:Mg/Co/Ni transporter MgtE
MRIVLGPAPKSSELAIFKWTYSMAILYIGSIIGCIVALLYILMNIFYLKKKLIDNSNSMFIRLLVILLIAIVVGSTHYILEKVIDII